MQTFGPPQFHVHHSFWGALATIGAGIATVATGGAAAPLIPIAANIGNAADAHNAEGKAAKQQVAAADQAGANFAPYNARGVQASNTLAGLLGMPDLPAGAWGGAGNTSATPAGPQGLATLFQGQPPKTAEQAAMDSQRGLGSMRGPVGSSPSQSLSSYGSVTLQSPDGQHVEDVPADQVQHWLKLGARPFEAVQ